MTRLHLERRESSGYTVIELMMALTVLAIGVSGIVAMQKVTVAANRHSKNLAIANHIAQAWLDALAADGQAWNWPSEGDPNRASDLGDTLWLVNANNNPGRWVRPTWNANAAFGPAFDALGNPVDDTTVNDAVNNRARFCTHIRMTWLVADNQPIAGNGLLRAEVRVFWPREGGGGTVGNQPVCSTQTDPAVMGNAANRDRYHFVQHTTAIRQTPAPRLR